MSTVGQTSQGVARTRRGLPAVPEALWAPLAGGALVLVPGLLGLAAGQPWLLPSLGPTAYLQAAQPQHPTSRFVNVVVGHLLALAAGVAAVLLLGAADEPSVFQARQLAAPRVWAAALAVAVTLLGGVLLRGAALHPQAAATALLVALGGLRPEWPDALVLTSGVLVVAAAGELLRRLRLAQPGQK
jgi:hypothetical protein